MSETVLIGRGNEITEIPQKDWESGLSQVKQHIKGRLHFMSEEHHLVHHFVVRELPRIGRPLSPELISERLGISNDRVKDSLDYLEKRMTFLYRNEDGEILWAYPVTAARTPHKIAFDTGEKLYAA